MFIARIVLLMLTWPSSQVQELNLASPLYFGQEESADLAPPFSPLSGGFMSC